MPTSGWEDRTFRSSPVPVATLLRLKEERSLRISVVLPALDEEATVGAICKTVRSELMEDIPFVDELIVVDSGSTDATTMVAVDAGATVHKGSDLLPDFGPVRGKGDCLWRSLVAVSGDIVVWLDSDTRNLHRGFVVDLAAPLLTGERFVMTKAYYDRPLVTEGRILTTGGARVTELVVRPLFQLLYPELVGLIQPLAGEYAGYVDAFRQVPFFTGYGVEVGLLLDVSERFGADRIAQVDLGVRLHRNRPVVDLGRTSFQVITALLERLDDLGRIKIPNELPHELLQFEAGTDGPRAIVRSAEVFERPPIASL